MSEENDLDGMNLSEDEKKEIQNCPHDIIDIQKFLQHLSAKKEAERMKIHTTSDGVELNLASPLNRIKGKIEHLSEDERNEIITKSNTVNSLSTKSRNYFKSAVGGYNNGGTPAKADHEKLLVEKKAELLEYFGRFYTVDEVHTICRKDWGTSKMSKQQLSLFVKDNYDEINRLKEKHKESFDHLRMTHKSSRLEELSWMYNKLKVKYEKTGSREDHRTLLQTIESVRKEVEGDRLTIQGNIDVNIQEEVNLQIRNELMRSIPLKEIIIGRLSARMGLAPRELLNDMSKSYYARLNSLLGEAEDVEFEELGFPSEQTYDFDHIQKVNEKKKRDDEQIKQKRKAEKKLQEAHSDKSIKLKEALLEKLRKKSVDSKKSQEELRKRLG